LKQLAFALLQIFFFIFFLEHEQSILVIECQFAALQNDRKLELILSMAKLRVLSTLMSASFLVITQNIIDFIISFCLTFKILHQNPLLSLLCKVLSLFLELWLEGMHIDDFLNDCLSVFPSVFGDHAHRPGVLLSML